MWSTPRHRPGSAATSGLLGFARNAWPVAIILVIVTVVIFAEVPGNRMYTRVAQDFAHVPAFGAITWCLLMLRRPHVPVDFVLAVAVAVALGGGVEIVQGLIGGDASLLDVWRDLLGATIAACICWLMMRTGTTLNWRLILLPGGLAALTSALALLPVAQCALAYRHRDSNFPVLADFHSRSDTYLLRATEPAFRRVKVAAGPGKRADIALLVPYSTATWPGVVFEEPVPDWRAFESLAIDIYNPGDEPQSIVVGIHDALYNGTAADRFTAHYELGAHTRKTILIPMSAIRNAPHGRTFDLQRVGRLAIAHEPKQPSGNFILYKVWLM